MKVSTFRFKSPAQLRILLALLAAYLWILPQPRPARAADATPHRTSAEILADLATAEKNQPKYNLPAQIDPRARHQMAAEMAPPIKHMVQLITELESVDKARALPWRSVKCMAMARLAIWGDADAPKSLAESANSSIPAEAVFGKAGLLMTRWWTIRPDLATDMAAQKEILVEFADLAKANSSDDALMNAALSMARCGSDSDELSNSLRDIAQHVLNGPAATRYHARPDKLGRPFKVSVRTLEGKTINTADWKGKVVLIDFWATWCPPCVAAVPTLTKRFHDNQAKGLEILGVSDDHDLNALKQFLASHPDMTWPQSYTPAGPNQGHVLAQHLRIPGVPTTYFIDRNGILRDMQTGYFDEELLQQLLKETVKPQTTAADTSTTVDASAPADNTPPTTPAPIPTANAAASHPATPPAPVVDEATEKQAGALLDLANSYIAIKRPDRAAEKLSQLISKYPTTKAATKARELLPQLTPAK